MPARALLTALAALTLLACGSEAPAPAPHTDAPAASEPPAAPARSAEPDAGTRSPADSARAATDLLTLAAGATLVSASSNEARALDLLNGALSDRAWTQRRASEAPPFTFVFELLAPTRLARVGVDNAADQPSPSNTTARSFRIEGSAEGPDSGFRELGTLEVAPERQAFVEPGGGAVRWLRFTLLDGHADGDVGLYFDEVLAFGEQDAVPADDGRFSGVYETPGRSYVELRQDGATLTGCYTGTSGQGGGTLYGTVEGGVARLQWRDEAGVSGTALFVKDSQGRLAGVRYRSRSRALWSGPAVEDATTPCSEAEPPANPVAQALEEDGRITLYGIYFDFDEATLRPESEPVLRQLAEALEAAPDLAVTIEGHTDSVGADAYNQALSQRRAQAVVDWLARAGIAADRLTPAGGGEAQPVASNDTADGRALNRRVEVVRR